MIPNPQSEWKVYTRLELGLLYPSYVSLEKVSGRSEIDDQSNPSVVRYIIERSVRRYWKPSRALKPTCNQDRPTESNRSITRQESIPPKRMENTLVQWCHF